VYKAAIRKGKSLDFVTLGLFVLKPCLFGTAGFQKRFLSQINGFRVGNESISVVFIIVESGTFTKRVNV
jgi:hypothetical protein